MSNWFASVNAKLLTMKQYCIDQCILDCDPEYVETSKAAYSSQFDDLIAAVNGYISDITNKQKQLYDIIITDFSNTLISEITYTPAIFKPTEPYPTGYSDYWIFYKMNGLSDVILAYSDSALYDGCIIDPDTTSPSLQGLIAQVTTAEAADAANRTELANYVRSFSQINALIFLTELISMTGNVKGKVEVGHLVYDTKHAKDIIQSFGLDIYIPSYIV